MESYSYEPTQRSWDDVLEDFGRPSYQDMCRAARLGDRDFLKRREQEGYPSGVYDLLIQDVVSGGSKRTLEWIWDRCVQSKTQKRSLVGAAFYHGHMDIIEWLWEKKFEDINENRFSIAASEGHIQVVQWLWDKGFRPGTDDETLTNAAGRGKIEMVKWLIDHGFPESESIIARAACCKQFDMVKWLWKQGHSCNGGDLILLLPIWGSTEISDWIKANPRD